MHPCEKSRADVGRYGGNKEKVIFDGGGPGN
jgi:hypothetical protein